MHKFQILDNKTRVAEPSKSFPAKQVKLLHIQPLVNHLGARFILSLKTVHQVYVFGLLTHAALYVFRALLCSLAHPAFAAETTDKPGILNFNY